MSKMGNPNWVKGGESPNPGGRKKNHARIMLERALEKAGKRRKTTFLTHVADLAFTDKDTRLAVLKTLVPTLKSIEADITSKEGLTIIIKGKEPEGLPEAHRKAVGASEVLSMEGHDKDGKPYFLMPNGLPKHRHME